MSTVAIFDGPDMFDPAIFDTRIKAFFVTINDEGGNVSDLLAKQVKYRRTFIEGESVMFDGGYFPKPNGEQSPQDYDLIGFSLGWTGLEEYTTKLDFENYIKSFMSDRTDENTGETILVQDLIDDFWLRSLE